MKNGKTIKKTDKNSSQTGKIDRIFLKRIEHLSEAKQQIMLKLYNEILENLR